MYTCTMRTWWALDPSMSLELTKLLVFRVNTSTHKINVNKLSICWICTPTAESTTVCIFSTYHTKHPWFSTCTSHWVQLPWHGCGMTANWKCVLIRPDYPISDVHCSDVLGLAARWQTQMPPYMWVYTHYIIYYWLVIVSYTYIYTCVCVYSCICKGKKYCIYQIWHISTSCT